LSLVASGRITPRDAERLLAVSHDREDTILRWALCLAFGSMLLPQVANAVTTIGQALPALLPAMERTLLLIGGMV